MSRTVLCLSRVSSKIGIPISDVVRAGTYRKEGSPFAEEAYYDGKGDRPDRETNCGDVSTSYPYACQAAEVEVDGETGEVKVFEICISP